MVWLMPAIMLDDEESEEEEEKKRAIADWGRPDEFSRVWRLAEGTPESDVYGLVGCSELCAHTVGAEQLGNADRPEVLIWIVKKIRK